ncbi:PTS system, sucrose-specific IIB component PTS system, sucrose-specific IIC component PTS system, sucrose-specific IIA component [Mesoplasma florum W37]|uniref:PTS system sucrose-specific IIB component, PTS system sucrose-specific IIC component, PTS system sucrose-specific IIA component n=1 Tax=Mesoplasma florum TaxID=2151 RepID=A0AAD0MP41_MESFO|nr:PTS transporter subunit EIIC [Mesoplasma florum]AGY41611.1 PTS system, sucrose-specific IIB component PTS system, sucrose-specific IIC component PTS system, sucrose-specific IIA component [Mesoplasma florum W37]AVN59821.1 PTS sugar transporter subunit IIA [Mesoplasma florum]AVN65949.1 PTS system sucrose-specific IIB component, PTS system sucrose-specific IIC component, PTS system sucrose-specific IIA component [Mesoplasma florum]
MKKKDYAFEAKRFIKAVGGKSNIESYLHCVTRLRLNLIDKTKVNEDEIKASSLTKGINYSQNQLQIILGSGVVEAVYEEVQKEMEVSNLSLDEKLSNDKLEDFKLQAKANKEALRNKSGFFGQIQKGMRVLGDIFVPIIPAIVAAGLAMGVAALLKQILKPSGAELNSLLWIIVDIITKTAFDSLAVLVCWSTVKRFGGNPVLGIIIGLMLVSPLLPNKGSIAAYDAQYDFIKNNISSENGMVNAYDLWDKAGLKWIGTIPDATTNLEDWALANQIAPIKLWIIPITGYQGSVLPALIIGICLAYLEKWIKSWMPKSVNMIFTPFLTIAIALLIALFFFGPILLMVEQGILIATKAILGIKYGFGTAIIAGLLQGIVITGCHQVLQGLEMQLVIDGSLPGANGADPAGSIFNAIWTASIISQGGAAMAIAIKAKDKSDKELGFSAALSTFFGITEPAIFGTNLPKVKPFIYASIGAFFGGLFAGALNVTCPGMGVTVVPGLLLYTGDWVKLLGIIGVNIIAFGSAFLLTFFLFKEGVEAKKTKLGLKFDELKAKVKFDKIKFWKNKGE